ncbi:MAG: 50S ribosomal protein L22 [Candidatus Yanofskybacteria bacterium RIFCSPLOWO2_01_FULL_41_34]|uniref:Large ribosomal subunit protein uL22 n=1 Tax=Candidatus Yanofskybacteria bacterium RIFCSPHIGHO2_01_FULL_41_26 TaxID=1802661 RepID=A0A1F8ECS9_9BACT|nr:MAG: 50S ribosomal protein L22 [Candidatus Yanofskybacteria bacterium RIFCSPHIGHO2_01_FULL_41_26]OGN22365.1 MAG: 50S ribosomal protein L22 [Candidatus Yanofskybacteria bacterium RIFCSPLOWO2_01_FULL_41_34]
MAEVKAQLNGLRISPRKVRAVTNLLKGKDVVYVLNQMEFLMKRPVLPLIKLLNSAIANAENNFSMIKDNLYIKTFIVDEGIKLKRYMPKAQGRAGEIQKKTSRVRLVLGERVIGLKRKASEKKNKEVQPQRSSEVEPRVKKPEVETELGKKGNTLNNLGKRLFRRKVI